MTTFTKKEKMMLVSSREIEKMRERGGKENIEGENDENVNIIKYINNNKKSVDVDYKSICAAKI